MDKPLSVNFRGRKQFGLRQFVLNMQEKAAQK